MTHKHTTRSELDKDVLKSAEVTYMDSVRGQAEANDTPFTTEANRLKSAEVS